MTVWNKVNIWWFVGSWTQKRSKQTMIVEKVNCCCVDFRPSFWWLHYSFNRATATKKKQTLTKIILNRSNFPSLHLYLSCQLLVCIFLSSMYWFTPTFQDSLGLPIRFLRTMCHILDGHLSFEILLRCPCQFNRLLSIASKIFRIAQIFLEHFRV